VFNRLLSKGMQLPFEESSGCKLINHAIEVNSVSKALPKY